MGKSASLRAQYVAKRKNPLHAPTREKGEFKNRADAEAPLRAIQEELNALQEVLYAQAKHGILIVLQAMDTGGKDGTIRHVLGSLNPQGVRVTSFKQPTPEELAHDYLWRIHRAVPAKGMIGVFNRSHYEDVLVVRVHNLIDAKTATRRYEQINQFEKYLTENGVTILKFYLHISKDEQRKRLQSRLDTPEKHWKFSSADIRERLRWEEYEGVYDTMLRRCSTPWAPWHVIPADRKWFRNYLVSKILLETMQGLELRYPKAEAGLDQVVIPD